MVKAPRERLAPRNSFTPNSLSTQLPQRADDRRVVEDVDYRFVGKYAFKHGLQWNLEGYNPDGLIRRRG